MTRCADAGKWSNRTRRLAALVGMGFVLLILTASVAMTESPREAALSAGRFLVAGDTSGIPISGAASSCCSTMANAARGASSSTGRRT